MNDGDNDLGTNDEMDSDIPQNEDDLTGGGDVTYHIGELNNIEGEGGEVSIDDFQEATEADLADADAAEEKAATGTDEESEAQTVSADWALEAMNEASDTETDGWDKDYA